MLLTDCVRCIYLVLRLWIIQNKIDISNGIHIYFSLFAWIAVQNLYIKIVFGEI